MHIKQLFKVIHCCRGTCCQKCPRASKATPNAGVTLADNIFTFNLLYISCHLILELKKLGKYCKMKIRSVVYYHQWCLERWLHWKDPHYIHLCMGMSGPLVHSSRKWFYLKHNCWDVVCKSVSLSRFKHISNSFRNLIFLVHNFHFRTGLIKSFIGIRQLF